jgi:acyl carrier protein
MTDDLTSRITSIIERQFADDAKVQPDDNLLNLGMDSLDYSCIQLGLEKEFGIEFTEDEFSECQTVRQIAAKVHERLEPAPK